MNSKLITLSFGIGLMLLATQQAFAQAPANCAERATVLDRLESQFGETRQSAGLGTNNVVVELFASAETGTWTITITMPSGLTCLVAAGEAYQAIADGPAVPGNDA